MAELTSRESSPGCNIGTKAGSKSCKLESTQGSTSTSPLNPALQLIFVRYHDHVLFHRSEALLMQPQTREAVGWLIYDCEGYIVLAWDRDAQPPTLKGGDPKASGLVLLKNDILMLQNLEICPLPLQKTSNWSLNPQEPIQEDEYAFRPTERKTHKAKDSKRRQQS